MRSAAEAFITARDVDALVTLTRVLLGKYPGAMTATLPLLPRLVAAALEEDKTRHDVYYWSGTASFPISLSLPFLTRSVAGRVFDVLNKAEEAIKAYQSALAIAPRDYETLLALGNVCAKFRYFRLAIDNYLLHALPALLCLVLCLTPRRQGSAGAATEPRGHVQPRQRLLHLRQARCTAALASAPTVPSS